MTLAVLQEVGNLITRATCSLAR